jgi:hypothetical protein
MYETLVRLMLIAALAKLGISATDFFTCDSDKCRQQLQKKTQEVLKVNWNPISVFPEEAKRFR